MGRPCIALSDDVYRIPTFGDYVNSFAFVDGDGSVTLVDCGMGKAPRRIVDGLAAMGKHPRDVRRIVLTHAHFDHAGGAAQMTQAAGLDGVEVHELDAEYVRTGTRPPRDTSLTSGRLLERFDDGRFAATGVSTELHDGDVIPVGGGLRIVHTPGHTPGHIALLHEASGVLITGDAIWNMASRRTWPVAAFCTSFTQNANTAATLGDLDYRVAAFTHGPEIREGAREQVRTFLRRKGVR